MKTLITIVTAVLLLMGCNGTTTTQKMNDTAPAIPDLLQVGHSILSRDTIEPTTYPLLSEQQRTSLAQYIKSDVPDSTQLIGVRAVNEDITLAAYKVPTGENPDSFNVYFATLDKNDAIIDVLNLREFHTSEHDGPMRLGGNRFHTTDAEVRFDAADHFTLHRVMTLTSLYHKGHRLTELWRAEWDNHYNIDANGHIHFQGQQETYCSNDDFDESIITKYKNLDIPDRNKTHE